MAGTSEEGRSPGSKLRAFLCGSNVGRVVHGFSRVGYQSTHLKDIDRTAARFRKCDKFKYD